MWSDWVIGLGTVVYHPYIQQQTQTAILKNNNNNSINKSQISKYEQISKTQKVIRFYTNTHNHQIHIQQITNIGQ